VAASDLVQARFGRFELDEVKASLLHDGKAISLAPTPFAVLCALARKPGALITKDALLDEVWGHQCVSESVLKTVIRKLRFVLNDDARQPRFIETVSRRGYRFIATENLLPAPSVALARVAEISTAQAPSFIGRAEPLSRLHRAWDVACSGKRAVVWVAGEPGIGKTMLIDHFVADLGEIACGHGQCVEHYGTGEPYLPVLEALAELCRRDSAVPDLLRAVAPTWLLQLPWLSTADERDALRRELAGVSPQRMLREMGELLDRYTERKPLLLVTEDVHWSDRATVQLIDYIARRYGNGRFMWLASFRPAEVIALDHPLNPLRHELRLHGMCEEIVLDPFSETEVADYVAQRSPALAGDEAFVRGLYERTDGVPLFVASIMSDVTVSAPGDGDDRSALAQLANVAVPENLTAIIDHYIARLGSEQRTLLSAAAVCGIEFRVTTIAGALERDTEWTSQICGELACEQLWLRAPRAGQGSDTHERPYSFRHALFRQVLYERTAPSSRAQLHRKVGAALKRERAAGAAVAGTELAMHFERGREPMTALSYYVEAAEGALLHLSAAECVTVTEHGLTLLDHVPAGAERNGLEIALATLRGVAGTHVLGVNVEAKSAYQRAYSLLRDVPQHPMRTRLLNGFGFLLWLRADYAEALAVAERALALSSETNDRVLVLAARIMQGEVHMLQGRPRAARTSIERGLALIEPLDVTLAETLVPDARVTLLGLLGIQLLHFGYIEQAREHLQQAYARARELGQPMDRTVAIWLNALFEVRLGEAERVAALADEMQALVDEFSLAHLRAACRWFRGWADARMGQPLEGYRRIREAYDENRQLGMLAGGSETLGYAAEALLLAGNYDAAEHELEEALEIVQAHGERVYLPQLFLIQAAIARARGQSAAAEASARQAIAEAQAQGAPWLELITLLDLCERDGGKAEDRHALAALVHQLREASDTAVCRRARSLLERTKDGRAVPKSLSGRPARAASSLNAGAGQCPVPLIS
jgi:DNA-binding winged helix-turn-helix (wHTH) protein/tetratricopeptide (TPR) repeat protein